MAINVQLADARGISEENRQEIQKVHKEIADIISSVTKEFTISEVNDTRHKITQLDYKLQDLWKFERDSRYHSYGKVLDRKLLHLEWVGRQFQCLKSYEVVTLTEEDVYERAFIPVGYGFVDIGVYGGYCRMSCVREVKNVN